MTCDEIMKNEVQTVGESATIRSAAEKMASSNIGFLPVVDDDGKVLGTITDRDIAVRAVAKGRSPDTTPVGEVMSREVVAVRSSDDLAAAEQLMVQHHKSRILVTDPAGRLQGVISLSDLAVREPGKRAAVVLREVSSREASRS
jgi:CBS domain-containing protein